MKKGLLLLIILLVTASSVIALPSYLGLRGLNRTVDAEPIGAGEFAFGLFSSLGLSNDTRTAFLSGDSVDVTDTEYDGTFYLTSAIGLGEQVELAGRISYIWNCLKRDDVAGRTDLSGGDYENDDGFSEAHLFMKFSTNPVDGLWIGIMPWVGFSIYDGGNSPYVINNNEYDGIWYPGQPMFELRRPMIGVEGVSGGADLLLSKDLNPIRFHLNVGYHYYKQHFEFTDYRYTSSGWTDSTNVDMYLEDPVTHLAAGFEYPLEKVTLFTEVEWRHFMKRDFEDGDGENFDDCITISPGVRIPTNSGIAFDITGFFTTTDFDAEYNDLGHSIYQNGGNPTDGERARYAPFPEGYSPKWGIGLNVMYSSDLRKGPGTAIMAGTVTDAVTGEFLAATVAFPGTAIEPAASDAETGFYTAELPEGSVSVAVNANGYIGTSETVQVAGGQDFSRDYALQPEPGTIVGSVTDIETGLAVSAAVSVSDVPATVLTGSDGLYSVTVPEGDWTVTATADGYLGATAPAAVASGEAVTVDFKLQSVSFEPVYFDVNVYSIKSEYTGLLDEIAAEIIANDLVVQICGHADSDYTPEFNITLSENRAKVIYDYLVDHGVSAGSLSTIGFGEDRPAVPNTSDANKALNRRVEFVVLSVGMN
ncbi:MAG: OmpA family protein [Candidatus Fermentibacteraceae bacterium]|nr:OmpA family protein [Candidatus Fermentibacteraceae bacterium]